MRAEPRSWKFTPQVVMGEAAIRFLATKEHYPADRFPSFCESHELFQGVEKVIVEYGKNYIGMALLYNAGMIDQREKWYVHSVALIEKINGDEMQYNFDSNELMQYKVPGVSEPPEFKGKILVVLDLKTNRYFAELEDKVTKLPMSKPKGAGNSNRKSDSTRPGTYELLDDFNQAEERLNKKHFKVCAYCDFNGLESYMSGQIWASQRVASLPFENACSSLKEAGLLS